ncbi:bifunctional tRNA (5-methylaminomethyl-2-thiouridine)(34)-methyltransferase MnmD/FAD-dependent 5-carboxymethylaminomethyl-2-thiouridine(34) oxidoreductase MnmC [Campylobacter sp. US33a]|uniref:bifunctional tRNA (5-methylaminomethyl-2-thiouridine)(34)-methyltransferase MnmD/FAD-dependent 5-carboxymethylaminomethyl-2-thiouridine(34) oxidoreductase MnmC n=1 Tax=Campylobacter sp. US33a TaxID=2498120 RepID=UPI001067606A|nr:bifunctional tRNA (5-methylaminomethyl-2-thiouridine)(34)-methyltransferase MnmD/FAD-dependent 5-carboxymethylaminomethyl-2-thiouridine(34) oxidoreductase MnmC [Campylobacter sp. US33a]TEY03586.1 bifunctional tRNA (5-methylaminomethyl-2-thiouridine)(34)-methyltransferase MnmD/FAD-dependent 5-carboxymethylaminomethyl-2-thiouridine(34) oxidoreductase MnmC [Campylobacter sp. US33a]
MQKARLIFKDNTPFSLDFDDFYFNSKDGVNESKFVYTQAFEFTEDENFIIAELGFGIGLNFFLSLKRFLNSTKRPKRLFYVSLENFYIDKELLRECYKRLNLYEEFKELLELFLEFYPKNKEGYYRFYFKDCFLDLVFKDAAFSLKELDFKADVWFLDGFSPSKNKTMFDEEIIKEIARLSKINTQILTFSASSFLQKNLKKYNFEVQKVKGFKKREMIKACFKGFEFECKEAYFSRVKKDFKGKKLAIIGAGISAASLAYELSLRGFEIEIFEKNTKLFENASTNASGILSSLILKPEVVLGELSQNAFIEASRFYQQILGFKPQGVYEFAYNELMQTRFDLQKDNVLFQICDNRAFLEDGGVIEPKTIVSELLRLSGAKIHFGYEFMHFTKDDNKFSLHFNTQNSKSGFDILIYASGADTKKILSYEAMNLSKVRGQVTLLKPFLDTKFALSSKAYITPIKNDLQLIGATYDRLNEDINPTQKDNEENIQNIKEFLQGNEKLVVQGAKVAFRSYSSDRFAIIGPAYDEEFYKKSYKALLWTKDKPQILPQNIENLYLDFAHGSRGFSTAILGARYICALICNEPLGLFKSFTHAIHPARFLMRKLKKGL